MSRVCWLCVITWVASLALGVVFWCVAAFGMAMLFGSKP